MKGQNLFNIHDRKAAAHRVQASQESLQRSSSTPSSRYSHVMS